MPLNRLQPKEVAYPQAKDAIDLVRKLQYDARYDAAFQQIFSKTIVCPNLEVAAGYAKSHQLNAITLDGDRAEKKGALTGGFHDSRQSRIEMIQKMKMLRNKLDTDEEASRKVKADLTDLEKQTTSAQADAQQTETKRRRLQSNYELLSKEAANMERENDSIRDSLVTMQKNLDSMESNCQSMGVQLQGIKSEMSVAFSSTLSDAEMKELEQLETQLSKLQPQCSKVRAPHFRIPLI